MKKQIHYTILFLFSGIFILLSCNEDGYTNDAGHILTFSTDTLNLGTLFTDLGTSTYMIKVYNRNKKPLLISSVTLANADKSGFRINVDGYKGTHFTDIEIAGKDSMYVFIEATVNSTNTDLPFMVKDSIVFLTNGVLQDVKLVAYGQNAFVCKGMRIKADTTFTAKRPILIYDSLHVSKDVTLTIEEGTTLFFHQNAGLRVYGTVVANGSLSAPVSLRGDRTDNMFSNLPYDRLPGQWEGVRFHSSSYGNKLDYINIRGAEYGIQCDSSRVEDLKIHITNSLISQVSGNALSLTSSKAVIANTEISNAGNNCVMLLGGEYSFIHCTIANYYSWSVRKGVALYMSNYNNNNEYPLENASFRNCIVAGSSYGEFYGKISDNENVPFNFYFSHCLINSEEKTGTGINNVTWEKDDNFMMINREVQYYDFRPESSSKAVNIGSLQDALNYPVDRNGISRISDEAPDAGCYEFDQ